MKKVYIFYDEKLFPSLGSSFDIQDEVVNGFKIYEFELSSELIMSNVYESFLERDKISVIFLDEKNNIIINTILEDELSREEFLEFFNIFLKE